MHAHSAYSRPFNCTASTNLPLTFFNLSNQIIAYDRQLAMSGKTCLHRNSHEKLSDNKPGRAAAAKQCCWEWP